MLNSKFNLRSILKSRVVQSIDLDLNVFLRGDWKIRAWHPFKGLVWTAPFKNLAVNEGLDHLLDVGLSGGSQDTTWFVGLLSSSPSPAASWTATEIASNDFVAYDEANLQAFTDGGVSGQSLDNSASPATFTVNADSSVIGGAYLIGTNAKGTPAGPLYAAGAFDEGDQNADSGYVLEVICTFSASAA